MQGRFYRQPQDLMESSCYCQHHLPCSSYYRLRYGMLCRQEQQERRELCAVLKTGSLIFRFIRVSIFQIILESEEIK